jgi:RND family efflux transporter MFP subunit
MKHANDIAAAAMERVKVVRHGISGKRFLMLALPLLIVALGVLITVYLVSTRPEVAAKPVRERVWTVAAVPAVAEKVQPEQRFFGRVVAGRETEVRAEVSGKVVEVGATYLEGGVVREGDLLVRLDPFDFDAKLREIKADLTAAEGMIARDEEQVEIAARDVVRRKKLSGRGHVSQKALDDAMLRLSEAQQRAIERRNRIEQLAVAHDRAERDLQDTRIVAPFGGFLVDVATAPGKFVNVGDKIAKAINAERLEVRFLVGNDRFNSFLSDGNYQRVQAKVLWAGKGYDAVLDRVEGEVQAASGGVEVFARLTDINAATNLRPGAFVEVTVPGPAYDGVIRLPEQAVYGGNTVYCIVDGRLDARTVTIAAQIGNDVLIRGDFSEQDRIVTTRFPEVGPGLKVRVP